MNIRIKNRGNLEFDLADLEVMIKDYIEEQGAIVSGMYLALQQTIELHTIFFALFYHFSISFFIL